MAAIKFVGLYWLIPLSLLLTTSFFVLYALRKETSKGLQIFGKVVVVFLWLAAGIVLFTGVYTLADDTWFGYPRGCRLERGMMGMDPLSMKNPHGGMMKYHEYDAKGNIILEEEPAPANATQE